MKKEYENKKIGVKKSLARVLLDQRALGEPNDMIRPKRYNAEDRPDYLTDPKDLSSRRELIYSIILLAFSGAVLYSSLKYAFGIEEKRMEKSRLEELHNESK